MHRFTLVAAILCACGSCALDRDYVRVTDARTGSPIPGAQVTPIYPSFNGAACETDKRGVAHVGGFGLPRGGYGVEVTAKGYEKVFIGTYPTAENHEGWRDKNMNVSLQPATRP